MRNFFIFFERETSLGNNPSPNSTGAARILAIFLTLLVFYDLSRNNLSLKLGSLIILFSLILLSLQSKFAFGSILIAYLILLSCLRYNFKKFISNISFFLIVPLVIFMSANNDNRYVKLLINLEKNKLNQEVEYLDKKVYEKKLLENNEIPDEKKTKNKKDTKNKKKKYLGDYDQEITTGRLQVWKQQYNYIKENNYLLIGKGIFADLKMFQITSSNSFIYSWLCGGLIAVIILIIFYLKVFYIIISSFFHILFRKREIEDNFIFQVLVIILLLRTSIENSFVSIPLDLFMMIFLIELYEIKKLNLFKNFDFVKKFNF